MPIRLTKTERQAIGKVLAPRIRKMAKKTLVKTNKNQGGQGIGSFFRSVGKSLGKVGKVLGPTVLKEVALPVAKQVLAKKIAGKGRAKGGGLRLAGAGHRKRR